MKKSLLTLPLLLLTSCASMLNSSPKEEKHKMELTLHKMRTDVEELRHDLNSQQMELHILEGKVSNQDALVANIKRDDLDRQQGKIEQLLGEVTTQEKQLARQLKKLEEVMADIRQLTMHANETTAALTQYKEKIDQVERQLSSHTQRLDDVAKIKTALQEIAAEEGTYTVLPGDTLEKIARKANTSIGHIKKINGLKDDLIFPGQELTLRP